MITSDDEDDNNDDEGDRRKMIEAISTAGAKIQQTR